MKAWKRLLIYLFLNVIVTGITMLAVLYVWDNTQIKDLLCAGTALESEA